MNWMKLMDEDAAFSNRKPKPFRKSQDEYDDEPKRIDKKRKKGPDYSLNRKAKRGEE